MASRQAGEGLILRRRPPPPPLARTHDAPKSGGTVFQAVACVEPRGAVTAASLTSRTLSIACR